VNLNRVARLTAYPGGGAISSPRVNMRKFIIAGLLTFAVTTTALAANYYIVHDTSNQSSRENASASPIEEQINPGTGPEIPSAKD
jgi:hypothetical protein